MHRFSGFSAHSFPQAKKALRLLCTELSTGREGERLRRGGALFRSFPSDFATLLISFFSREHSSRGPSVRHPHHERTNRSLAPSNLVPPGTRSDSSLSLFPRISRGERMEAPQERRQERSRSRCGRRKHLCGRHGEDPRHDLARAGAQGKGLDAGRHLPRLRPLRRRRSSRDPQRRRDAHRRRTPSHRAGNEGARRGLALPLPRRAKAPRTPPGSGPHHQRRRSAAPRARARL